MRSQSVTLEDFWVFSQESSSCNPCGSKDLEKTSQEIVFALDIRLKMWYDRLS